MREAGGVARRRTPVSLSAALPGTAGAQTTHTERRDSFVPLTVRAQNKQQADMQIFVKTLTGTCHVPALKTPANGATPHGRDA